MKATSLKGDSNYNVRKPVDIPKNYTMTTYNLESVLPANKTTIPGVISIPTPAYSSIDGMRGGEDEALRRLNHFIFESDGLKYYKHTRKGLIGKDYSSKISLWLAYGCIGPRYYLNCLLLNCHPLWGI